MDMFKGPLSPAGRTVLVTGAGSGIGRATSLHLAQRGFEVYAGVLNQREYDACAASPPAETAAAERLNLVIMDVTSPPSLQAAAKLVHEGCGGELWGVINCAGVSCSFGPVEHVPVDKVKLNFEVNCIGVINVLQAFLPQLRAAEGRVVNVSSYCGFAPFPFYCAYNMSKFAVEGLTETLRLELRAVAPRMRVVLLQPGNIYPTDMNGPKSGAHFNNSMAPFAAAMRPVYGTIDAVKIFTSNEENMKKVHPAVIAAALERALTSRRPPMTMSVPSDIFLVRLLKGLLPDWAWTVFHYGLIKGLWKAGCSVFAA